MSITETLLHPLLRAGGARPLITHYDDTAGTRVELSAATVANWAAKTANWLHDEFDVEPGTSVAVRLPAHWQTMGILLGAWWCGARVTADSAGAAVAFVPPDARVSDAQALAVVSLDPMGMALREPPAGDAFDYVSEARVCPDDFLHPVDVPGDTPALLDSTVDDVLAMARTRAEELGIPDGARVLSTLDWDFPGGVLDGLLAVLVSGAALVQCTAPDPAKLPDRRATERTTVQLGDPT